MVAAMIHARILLCALLALLCAPAYGAGDGHPVYTPEQCEFAASLPGPPHRERRCPDDDAKSPKCHEVVSFTKVFDLSATLTFRLTCNPLEAGMYERYDTAVMKATLEGMVASTSDIKDHQITLSEQDNARVASLVGAGELGLTPTMYVAQLWIGRKSIFTVEAQLIGEEHKNADEAFRDILSSIHHIETKAKAEEKKSPAEKPKPEPAPQPEQP